MVPTHLHLLEHLLHAVLLMRCGFQVNLCGHATLASAHFLFKTVLAEHGMVEFMTRSGILTAKKVTTPGSVSEEEQGKLFIELDFPMDSFVGCNTADDMPLIPETLNGASLVSVHKSKADGDLIVPSLNFFLLAYLLSRISFVILK
jgi:hypothetical protein